ncbi:MAG TPA: polysaccharide deacetylase family protein [Steroidobacteraceae bacterium]|nr:polysaccharide deacetylase family protein [Steroidobacteraceae bacterium]
MKTLRIVGAAWLVALFVCSAGAAEKKLKVALTFDDLPINGTLPEGSKQSDFARDTIAVLKKHRIPPSYGFINANKLEHNPDGALALRIWVDGGHPLANHTYNHLNFTQNSVEDFEREILRNEPALELLMPPDSKLARSGHDWRWFRYPYLHEGDTLEKRRAVRAFLAANGYRIAQTTLDWEDYMWNSAHARCSMKKDEDALRWLRESYLDAARAFIRFEVDFSRKVFGRDIHHVMLLHLGSFSSHILPDLFKLLDEEGFEIVTLEEAQKDPVYDYDPDVASPNGGTLTELGMEAKHIPWPDGAPVKPRERVMSICQ